MQLGQDKTVVEEITREVVRAVRKPVYAKLTPNAGNIGEIAKSAISAGAEGIVAINTVGPGYYSFDGNAVLTNKVGGLSGIGITPIGLKCVRDIRQTVGDNVPIITMGGIRGVVDVEAYAQVGATFFGIGSALAGMNEEEIKAYFSALRGDLDSNGWTNNAASLLKTVNMQYQKSRVEKRIDSACDFKIIQTDSDITADPGQFVFVWIPGVGEKPFSVMDDNPLTLGVLERGEFTKRFNSLQQGDYFYVRGPYGQGVKVPPNSEVVLVGGGCGIAGLYLLAKRLSSQSNVLTLLAAKDHGHIAYLEEFRKYGQVRVATEDGSSGKKGLVTNLMGNLTEGSYFFNCGPKAMINAVLPLELAVSNPERVYSSVDYMTRCGVGICGSCADTNGRRTCIEGPFMNP
jgi:dihydroorotate dehydrogenase (NAD+) catalytic subunit